MGRKSMLFAFVLSVSLPAALAHAAVPRPPEGADPDEVRAYRISVKQERLAVRDSALRQDNLMVGITPFIGTFSHDW